MTTAWTSRERPVAAVPGWILGLLAASLSIQIAWQATGAEPARDASDLPRAPAAQVLRLAGFGESAALARLAMVWLLAFDSRAGNAIPYQKLDYDRLAAWLDAILAVDPRSNFPLFAAARLYAENDNPAKARRMVELVFARFGEDPNRRWPLLAHVALLAKHRLHDLPLARQYAAALQRQTTDPTIPAWARQMEIFVLEDMNELEAAKVVLGGLLATGKIGDAEERRFLQSRLEEIERRLKAGPKR
ncbi:MAG: hypothetical protein IT514_00495 [Burkholderiales bacterium]|nr:hypothetical protein [Burkholderiales bacterium]